MRRARERATGFAARGSGRRARDGCGFELRADEVSGATPRWSRPAAASQRMWRLGTRGRVVVRASGTQPVIRVLAEAEDEALVAGTAEGLAALIRACAASPEP